MLVVHLFSPFHEPAVDTISGKEDNQNENLSKMGILIRSKIKKIHPRYKFTGFVNANIFAKQVKNKYIFSNSILIYSFKFCPSEFLFWKMHAYLKLTVFQSRLEICDEIPLKSCLSAISWGEKESQTRERERIVEP